MRLRLPHMIAAIVILTIMISSCGSSRSELVPGRFAGFTLSEYMDISTSTSLGGKVLDLRLDDTALFLQKEFAKGTRRFSVYVAKFESVSQSTGFWYTLIRDISSELRAFVSAIPWVYGEFSGEIDEGYIKTWFFGKWFYLFLGSTKEEVNSAVDAFKEFERSLVRSVES
ncbi:MAG TPA: hypothetical protein ENN47_01265 [Mesotoga infera]|uniref:Lipoprotein n=1 Tax=Mesotoga infera TaxID=1236046 RepID=A0A7C1GRR6_9BACT|nr:hypothetical protein [Mesotoga infera]